MEAHSCPQYTCLFLQISSFSILFQVFFLFSYWSFFVSASLYIVVMNKHFSESRRALFVWLSSHRVRIAYLEMQ